MDAQLRIDVLHMGLHGIARKHELLLDVRGIAAVGEQREDLRLARREPILMGHPLAWNRQKIGRTV